MKHLLLIVNPAAGTKKATKNLSDIISVFNKAEFDTHVYITTCQGDATEAVKKFGKKADLIVCSGGDGTLNETITGIIEAKLDVPLGYIPAGSTNDFAGSLHLSHNVITAAEQIVNGQEEIFDIGKFGDRYFSYVASFGAFTKTSYATPQNIKNSLGYMAYILDGIQELSNIRKEHLCIEIDDETFEDDYLFGAVCNSTSVGGILTLRSDLVDMSDGLFEILLIRAPKDFQEMGECLMSLKNQTYDCGMITFRSGKRVTVQAKGKLTWALDGEKANSQDKIVIENLHHRIRLVH